ncbi:putative pectinesterase/pectinesterase inhibitor 24 [Asparagus officinalis]|uniref:putative pectinesterase/pectinesterase inhibitor 24 n=1 Tax=Asparagus officinalis TaxID=4686 RepID=UPI00098E3E52|nr:putative pectinesterase/pectinesterase inhibitor 24 [Asparagus officinalis]
MFILAVNHNDSSDDSNCDGNNINATPFSTSIKAMCDATLYPNSCIYSLSSVANSTEFDPVKLFNLTPQVAINAVANCNELIELAIDHINDCVTSSIDFSSEELVNEIKTWLSSAITNQQTCIDGFNKSTVLIRNSTEFTRRNRKVQDDKGGVEGGAGKSNKRTVIYVKKWVYYENVRVKTKKWNVLITGDGKNMTVVSGRPNTVDGTPTFSTATFGTSRKHGIDDEYW